MSSEPFVSFAPNREDVILHRALRHEPPGAFLDLGVPGPLDQTVGFAFTRRGWIGVTAAAGEPFDQLPMPGGELHFVVIDAAPSKQLAIFSWVLARDARPWVVVLRHTEAGVRVRADSGELAVLSDRGYDLCLDDGVSLFLADRNRPERVRTALSVPVNVGDDVVYQRDVIRDAMVSDLARRCDQLVVEHAARDEQNLTAVLDWRRFAVDAWTRAVTAGRTEEVQSLRKQIDLNLNHIKVVDDEVARLRAEVHALQHTVSWRVTRPLRTIRSLTRRVRG